MHDTCSNATWMPAASQPAYSFATVALAEQSGSLLHLYINLAVCAVGQSRLGYHEPASENMSRSEAVARQLGGGAPARGLMMSDIHLVLRAELALNRGQPEQTLNLVEEGLQLARRTGNIYASALAHRLRAQALSTLGSSPWETIQESLATSLSSFQAGQGAIEVARTHAVWGTLSCMRGHDEEARSHLRAASEQFVRSGFDAELAAVQAALRVLVQKSGEPVTRQQLMDRVFSDEEDVQSSAVDVLLHRLRRRLDGSGVRIHTYRGLGYVLEPHPQPGA